MPCRFLFALFLVTCTAVLARPAEAREPVVAAAADLKYALAELAARYKAATGREVRLAFGSSGNFAQQIVNGAPFELLLSADEGYVEHLAANGLTRDTGALYGIGRVVLFVPARSPLKADPALADLRAALADGRVRRFAIANPEHAPYGRAAREVLQSAGLWQPLRGVLVLGENASQAMQFAASGNTQGGIVPLALAMAPEVATLGTAALLPESMHRPLRQRMVLTKKAGSEAADFYRWLQTPPAREVFVRHGFALPGGV
jgi:molybdate transport system substrate-binding protein